MSTYTKNQRVEATVERIFPFGVFVRLADGAEAYIRRRELDLDADVDPRQVVHEGENITAVIINPINSGRHIELSRRLTLPDPWPDFAARFTVGDVIQGTVRALHPRGAFIRLQPGIDGFIPLDELTPQSIKTPEDVLWVDDDIEAIITRIIPARNKVDLSIRARIEKLDQAADVASRIGREFTTRSTKTRSFDNVGDITEPTVKKEIYQEAGPVLIVEDDDTVRESLKTWLSERKIQVFSAATASQAYEASSSAVKISMIDLNLPDFDGLELIQSLRETGNSGYICVMSTPEDLADRAEQIQAARVAQVFAKPLDMEEIKRLLAHVVRGEQLVFWRADTSEFRQKGMANSLRSLEAPDDTLIKSALREITVMLQAQIGLLFWQDPASKTISIQFQFGEDHLNLNTLYSLYESPVKDVIVDGESILENRVLSYSSAKFDKLLDLLTFQSCIGVAVPVLDEIHHAAFFFHNDEDAFPKYRLRDARHGALLLSALLTDQHIREQLLSLNPMLLSGELAAGFGHDVFNKITGLELEARNLIDIGNDGKTRSQRILDLILDLKGTVQAFQQLLRKKEHIEPIDVNNVLKQSLQLIIPLARKERVHITQKLANELPRTMGNGIFLQQVFINIMLNAIQQMALKAGKYEWKGKRVLEISSILSNDQIQIRFQDNGPGIHKLSLGKLFTPGFSTRNGSGLGLFIALGFIKKLGGRLIVDKTFVPLGTTFLVELPVVSQE